METEQVERVVQLLAGTQMAVILLARELAAAGAIDAERYAAALTTTADSFGAKPSATALRQIAMLVSATTLSSFDIRETGH